MPRRSLRTANNPGRYTLGENIRLIVSRRPDGTRIVNEASIQFFSPDPTRPPPGKPREIKLPDGYNTWAAAWMAVSNVLWVLQQGSVHRYDFTAPADVKETTLEVPGNRGKVPEPIFDALRAMVNVLERLPLRSRHRSTAAMPNWFSSGLTADLPQIVCVATQRRRPTCAAGGPPTPPSARPQGSEIRQQTHQTFRP